MKTAAGCARSRRCRRGKRSPSAARSCSAGCGRRGAPASASSRRWSATRAGRRAWRGSTRRSCRTSSTRADHLVLYGTLERNPYAGLQFTNPDFELIEADDADTLHTGRIVPVYERARSITPKMQRRLVADALLRLPPDLDDPLPADDPRAPAASPAASSRSNTCTSRRPARRSTTLNVYQTPAQRRLVFEEFFRFQVGLLLRKRESEAERKALATRVDDRDPRGAPGRAAVPPHARPARGAQGDRRRHAAPAPDEPPAAGRRRRGKDDCRGAGGGARDGERPAGRVHGAHRDPRRAALRDRAAAARGHAVPGRAADGPPAGAASAAALGKAIAAGEIHLVVGTHALVQKSVRFQRARPRRHRRAAPLRRAAARDAAREGAAARHARDDGHADPAHARAHDLRRSRRVVDPRSAARPHAGADRGEAGRTA